MRMLGTLLVVPEHGDEEASRTNPMARRCSTYTKPLSG
jgi:hypothetical protein